MSGPKVPATANDFPLPDNVVRVLTEAASQGQRCVLMTCGISGSGKSTLAKAIVREFPSFVRFSIDQHVFDNRGVYEKDFPPEMYEPYQEEAEAALKQRLAKILVAGKGDVVLDYSFWNRDRRDEYRDFVATYGAGVYQVVLVYFQATEDVLWRRVEKRHADRAASADRPKEERDPAYLITKETFRRYVDGFNIPNGEDEIIVNVE